MDIQYNVVSKYDTLQNKWEKLHGKTDGYSVFSIIEDEGENRNEDWMVSHPDILSPKPLIKGKVTLKLYSFEEPRTLEVKNPTWKDVAVFFHDNNNGHHVFLEWLEFDKKTKTIEFVTGS